MNYFVRPQGLSRFIIAILLFLALPNTGRSEEELSQASGEGQTTTLNPVIVVGEQGSPAKISSSSLSGETIEALPLRNENLNEALTVLPGVQVSDTARSSRTGGEILPPNISISGGKIYQNNFLIDGLGNNSLLDPTFSSPSHKDFVPGHPQEVFIAPDLLESVKVYRSNVPARYGRFTGGVVDSQIRKPALTFRGKLGYRTTRSEWTSFHVSEDMEEKFRASGTEANQPRFRKEDAHLTLDVPLGEHAGVLLHYSRLNSEIPLRYFNGDRDQNRLQETLQAKFVLTPTPETEWTFSGIWSPYEAEYFRGRELTSYSEYTRDSDYTIEGGGYGLTGGYKRYLAIGSLDVKAGYRRSNNSRKAPKDFYQWAITPSKSWGDLTGARYSPEGGYGDLDNEQETITAKADFLFEPISVGETTHVFGSGIEYEHVRGSFERPVTTEDYLLGRVEDVVCANDDPACIEGEQFLSFKTIRPEDSAVASIDFGALYFEDAMTWKRILFRPGVRLSRNDLLKNTDVAHRLSSDLDLFGNGRSILTGGINRYYGKTFLTFALAEEKKPSSTWIRSFDASASMPTEWQLRGTSTSISKMSDLDTPYTDEYTIGLNQYLLGGRLNLLWIERKSRDELTVRTYDIDDYTITEWTNEGKGKHREFSLAWERQWDFLYVAVNATWQETTTSHLDYKEGFEGDANEDPVLFNGRLLKIADLPADDYNREWIGNFVLTSKLPWGFSFTNLTRYRSGYEGLKYSGEEESHASFEDELKVYETIDHPESWIFDWKLAWTTPFVRGNTLTLTAEVLNVFNKKILAGAADDEYEIGRQLWAGAEWRF